MTLARTLVAAAALAAAVLPATARAQATVKPDGQWRAVLAVGFSLASGNTDSTLLNVQGDAVRATATDRLNVRGLQTYGATEGARTSDLAALGARSDGVAASARVEAALDELAAALGAALDIAAIQEIAGL